MIKENEEKLLACIFADPLNIHKLSILEEHFFFPETRRMFSAMNKCVDAGIKIDYISVCDRDDKIDRKYAPLIADMVLSGDSWKMYQDKIINDYQLRALIKIGNKLSNIKQGMIAEDNIQELEDDLLKVTMCQGKRGVRKLGDFLPDALKSIEERTKNKGTVAGLTTGLSHLDTMIGGLQPSQMIVIGARPSQGKSALGLNIACHISIGNNIPIGFISAESSGREVTVRTIVQTGYVRGASIRSGFLSQSDMQKIIETSNRIKNAPFYIHDAPNLPFHELKSRAREMVISYKIKALFVDYLQIIEPPKGSGNTRHEQVGAISMGLKQIARELEIPVVVLAQLRRDADDREPQMSDLADSSQIEKDADVVLFIHHDKNNPDISRLLNKKARDAETGNIPVIFKREYVRFHELEVNGKQV